MNASKIPSRASSVNSQRLELLRALIRAEVRREVSRQTNQLQSQSLRLGATAGQWTKSLADFERRHG